jgi:mRNA interferase MazF
MIGRLNTVTIAPVTSTVRGVPSEVPIGPESGLKQPSAVNLHHVATVPLAGIRTYVGVASPKVMRQVREALLFALGFVEPDHG